MILRLVTLNVLCDDTHSQRIQTPTRHRAIWSTLGTLTPHVIGLQEVSQQALGDLMTHPWAKAHTCSDTPHSKDLHPHGQVLLTTHPVTSSWSCRFGPHKRAVAFDLQLPHRVGALTVCVLHLTSSRKQPQYDRRAAQLSQLLGRLPARAVIMGDFNFDHSREANTLLDAGFTDLWPHLHPGDPGFTFDPTQNGLAALMSQTTRPKRYDRVFVRGKGLRPHKARLILNTPLPHPAGLLGPLFASDHFGICAEIEVTAP